MCVFLYAKVIASVVGCWWQAQFKFTQLLYFNTLQVINFNRAQKREDQK